MSDCKDCSRCTHLDKRKSSWTNSSYDFARYSSRAYRREFEVTYVYGICRCKQSPFYDKTVLNTRFSKYGKGCEHKKEIDSK